MSETNGMKERNEVEWNERSDGISEMNEVNGTEGKEWNERSEWNGVEWMERSGMITDALIILNIR
jgi:hypothetical protein